MAFDRPGGGGRGPGGPREMFPAKCTTCGKDIQVPFRPTEGRPVYCNEHFVRKEGPRRF